jgi:hypothetical protein
MWKQVVSVLKSGANFNQFSFLDVTAASVITEDGFKEFCDFFIEQDDKLLELTLKQFNLSAAARQIFYQLIEKSKNLEAVEFVLENTMDDKETIYTLLARSVKTLTLQLNGTTEELERMYCGLAKLIQNSAKLEELDLNMGEESDAYVTYFKEALRATLTLRKLNLHMPTIADLSMFEDNESLTEYGVDELEPDDMTKVSEIMLRNRKLQNERVRNTIIAIYHIAMLLNKNISQESYNLVPFLPCEMWTNIFSLIKYPGVSLDFGSVLQAILTNPAIRRVI